MQPAKRAVRLNGELNGERTGDDMHQQRTARHLGGVILALAAAAAAAVLAGCADPPAAAAAAVPASAIGRLTAIARRAATLNGDPAPAWITAVMTTRAKALTSATPGDYVPGSARTAVFLITMRGHFTAVNATGPPGAKAPTGRYLSLVVDAKTFRGLDAGISPRAPPVAPASLGPVTYLSGRGQ
jgi:hypothetical protein